MFKRFLVSFLFLAFLMCGVLQAHTFWTGDANDNLYCTPENWDRGVPEANYTDYMTGLINVSDMNQGFIDDPDLNSPVIFDDCNAPYCAKLAIGRENVVPGTGLEIRGGTLRPIELIMGIKPGSSGKVHMTGGVVNMWDYSYLAVGDGGDGEFVMDGGEINCHLSDTSGGEVINWAGGVMVPKSENGPGSTGHLQLNGGIIRCRYLKIKDGGTVDIAGGTLAMMWAPEAFEEYISDGVLTAYGGDERTTEVVGAYDWTGFFVLTGYQYDLGQAYNPSPCPGAAGVPLEPLLSWTQGDYAVTHEVYFGTDEQAVEEATIGSPEHVATRAYDVNYYDPGVLQYGKTYYWRVDEHNPSHPNSPWKGLVWSFMTPPYLEVDDFDSYESDEDLLVKWSDWEENGTSAVISIETADANFIIYGHSMQYFYDNDYPPYYSESTRIFSPSMDWVTGGIRALSLSFHGEPDNDAERMYLRVTDGGSPRGEATIVYEDSNDLIQEPGEAWHEWNIALSELSSEGVDLNDINGITIGFGDRDNPQEGPEGYVYFENIRVYLRRCVEDHSYGFGDITGDCAVNYYDLEIMAQDWLAYDYNTVGKPGALMGFEDPNSSWRPTGGRIGGALYFSGGGDPNVSYEDLDRVEIDPLDLMEPDSDGVTITAWIKPDGPQNDYTGIVFSRDGSCVSGLGIMNNYMLEYHWDDFYWGYQTGLYAQDATWCFVALVVNKDSAIIWCKSGTQSLKSKKNTNSHNVDPFDGIVCIGEDNNNDPRHFKGLIDDVRIYEYALDSTQISQLANLSGEPSPGPLVRYELNESSGAIASDSINTVFYHGIDSAGNVYDEEPIYHKAVNLRDFSALADNWLAADMLWP